MCEANVYLTARDSQIETLFLEAVDQIIPEGLEIWRLISIFGEQKILAGHIKSMNLVNHRIIFESSGA
ncbi:MAG: RNA-binding protein [Candidatus Adiutrix intracellularis]|nr:MAG: RNA-binding protein [Candidatus Adiutrix intracellularis]